MHLASLTVTGFRKLNNAHLVCSPGLNVLVGENNAGKTAFVDALRTIVGRYTPDDDDFYVDRTTGVSVTELSIAADFTGLVLADEARFLKALVAKEPPGTYAAHVEYDMSTTDDVIRRQTTVGSSGAPAFEYLSRLNVIYLPPLRDPETGLRPGRASQIGELMHRVAGSEQRAALEEIARQSNAAMAAHDSIRTATGVINTNLRALSGVDYAQNAALAFAQPTFQRLVQNLEALAEGLPITHNGLGSGNLLYIAAVLGNLAEDQVSSYKALIVEEPEAHLHPQFQILLLRYLQTASTDANVQVFVTTHSPILASQAAADQITIIRERPDDIVAAPVSVEDRDASLRVRQYLDATRSELFFARRLLLVEGDAERLLLPELGKRSDFDVSDLGISVVSAAGLNFDIFLPFVGGTTLGIPVAILSDGDPPNDEYPGLEGEASQSGFARCLLERTAQDPFLRVFLARKTFEYDLCLHAENRVAIMAAMRSLHSQLARDFEKQHGRAEGIEFARAFYSYFFQARPISKPRFANELAVYLSENPDAAFTVPRYITDALTHLRARPG